MKTSFCNHGLHAGSSTRFGNHGRRNRRGGIMILEAAATIIALLVVTLGLLQYAIYYHTTLCVQYAARDAARYAAVNGRIPTNSLGQTPTTAITEQAVKSARLIGLNLRMGDVVVTPPANVVEFSVLTVTINYPMSRRSIVPNRFFGIPIFGGMYTVTEEVVLEGD